MIHILLKFITYHNISPPSLLHSPTTHVIFFIQHLSSIFVPCFAAFHSARTPFCALPL